VQLILIVIRNNEMKIPFKYYKIYCFYGSIIGSLCAIILIVEPLGISKNILTLCYCTILFIGLSGAITAILEKTRVITFEYSEKDKKTLMYKFFNSEQKIDKDL